MSYTRRDDILRAQHGAALNYLLALVEPIEHDGRFIDGFELYSMSATFHADIDAVLRHMLPALVNGFAFSARKMDQLRQQRQLEELQLARTIQITPEDARKLFGETVFERVRREDGER